MKSKVLLSSLAIILARATPCRAQESGGIYFRRDDAKPWQNCYAVPAEEAFERLSSGRFTGASLVAVTSVEHRGDVIELRHRDSRDGRTRVVDFKPCPFKEPDR